MRHVLLMASIFGCASNGSSAGDADTPQDYGGDVATDSGSDGQASRDGATDAGASDAGYLVMETIPGSDLTLEPDWAIQDEPEDPDVLSTLYAPDPTAEYAFSFPVPGRYEISLSIEVWQEDVDMAEAEVDEVHSANFGGLTGEHDLPFEFDVAEAREHVIRYLLFTEPDESNLGVRYRELRIRGPQ